MKKSLLFLLCILSAFQFTGCKSNEKNIQNTSIDNLVNSKKDNSTEGQDNTQININQTDNEEDIEIFCSDNIVNWGVPDIYNIRDRALAKLNKDLIAKGYAYNVNFVKLSYDDYYNALIEYEAAHGSLDIAFAGLDSFGDESYHLIKSGYYSPLEDYLSESGGKELYQLFDTKLWDSVKVNGEIYTIPSGSAKNTSISFAFNKAYIDEQELDGFTGDIAKLQAYMKKIPFQSDFSHIIYYLNEFDCCSLLQCDYKYGLFLSHDGTGAHNPFEFSGFKKYMTILNGYYKSGYINYDINFTSDIQSCQKFLNSGKFFVFIGAYDKAYVNSDVIIKSTTPYMTSRLSGSSGIAEKSTKKEEAFQLLSLVYTNEEFANLLVYGILDTDYQLINGAVCDMQKEPMNRFCNELSLGIYEKAFPMAGEAFSYDNITDKQNYYRDTVKASPFLGMNLETEGYKTIITDITKIINNHLDICRSDNIEAEFENVDKELVNAGINELISEMNNQFGIKYPKIYNRKI